MIDIAVSVSLVVIAVGCSIVFSVRRTASTTTQKLMSDLAALQLAEDTLQTLQQTFVTCVFETRWRICLRKWNQKPVYGVDSWRPLRQCI